MKVASKIISYLFHPLLIPTWMILLMQYANPYWFFEIKAKLGVPVIAAVTLYTFIYPMIAILLLRKLEFIDSLEMPDSKQRIIPMIITIVLYVWVYLIFKSKGFPLIAKVFMMGTLVSLFLSFFINVFQKLSLHMVGISGALIASLLVLYTSAVDIRSIFLLIVVATGAVASARLYLEAHNWKEIYAGFLVGIFGQVFGLLIVSLF